MTLWFENSFGRRRQICDCSTWEEVSRSIDEFITQANDAKPKDTIPFKRYYTRMWEEDGMTKIDVGSHTEFFYWENLLTAVTMGNNGEAYFEYAKNSDNG